jgi:hypothetical protein
MEANKKKAYRENFPLGGPNWIMLYSVNQAEDGATSPKILEP